MISRLNPASAIVYSKDAATGRRVLRSPLRGLRPRKTMGKESHSGWNLAMVLWYGIGMVGRTSLGCVRLLNLALFVWYSMRNFYRISHHAKITEFSKICELPSLQRFAIDIPVIGHSDGAAIL